MFNPLLYMVFFLIYTVLILWLGKYGIDRSKTLRDYYTASGSLGLFLSVSTFGATWFSAASMLGLPGLIYEYGYSAILYSVVCWFLGSLFIIMLAKRLRSYNVVTIPHFFYKRYGSAKLQMFTGLILVITYILYIVIQIRGFGIVISFLLDIPYTVAIFLVYLFLLYTTYGGLFSVARTDALNFCLIIAGSLLAAFFVLHETGGWLSIHESIREKAGSGENHWFDPFYYGKYSALYFISSLFSLGIGLAANPQYAIRLVSAKSTKTAIRMVGIATLLLGVVYMSTIVVGLGSIVLIPDLKGMSPDEVYPLVIDNILTSPWKGLILVSIVAACISTANSQLLLLASSLVYDVYGRFKPSHQSENKRLAHNKWSITVLATVSLILSLNAPEGLLLFSGQVWGIIAVTFFFPLFGGLFIKGATKRGAYASIVVGLSSYVLCFAIIPPGWQTYIQPTVPALILAGITFWMLRNRHETNAY